MIQNAESVVYKVRFDIKGKGSNKGGKTKQQIETFLDQIGVQITIAEITEDLDQWQVKFVSKYAWKLVVMDRSFSEGAKIFSVSRLD